MKKPTSKADIRDTLTRETERFLRQGGEVEEIDQGISGREAGDPSLFANRRMFVEPKTSRTLVPEVIAAIEARKEAKKKHKPTRKGRLARPRRKVIYDDFGEPLRHIWVDE